MSTSVDKQSHLSKEAVASTLECIPKWIVGGEYTEESSVYPFKKLLLEYPRQVYADTTRIRFTVNRLGDLLQHQKNCIASIEKIVKNVGLTLSNVKLFRDPIDTIVTSLNDLSTIKSLANGIDESTSLDEILDFCQEVLDYLETVKKFDNHILEELNKTLVLSRTRKEFLKKMNGNGALTALAEQQKALEELQTFHHFGNEVHNPVLVLRDELLGHLDTLIGILKDPQWETLAIDQETFVPLLEKTKDNLKELPELGVKSGHPVHDTILADVHKEEKAHHKIDDLDEDTIRFLDLIANPKIHQDKLDDAHNLMRWDAATPFESMEGCNVKIDALRQDLDLVPNAAINVLALIDELPPQLEKIAWIDSVGAVELPKAVGPYMGQHIAYRAKQLENNSVLETMVQNATKQASQLIQSLLISGSDWERLPTLDIGNMQTTNINVESMSHSIMKGTDKQGRVFLALKFPGREVATCLTQIMSYEPRWVIWNGDALKSLNPEFVGADIVDHAGKAVEPVYSMLEEMIPAFMRKYDPHYRISAKLNRTFCNIFSTAGKLMKFR